MTMFSALAAVCTVYCAIEIVLITLHYITLLPAIILTTYYLVPAAPAKLILKVSAAPVADQ